MKKHVVFSVNQRYFQVSRPVVSLDCSLGPNIPSVSCDHAEGGRQAAQLLLNAGCRHVLQVRDSLKEELDHRPIPSGENDLGQLVTHTVRHTEFERVIREAGIGYEEVRCPLVMWESVEFAAFMADCYQQFRGQGIDGIFGTDLIVGHYVNQARRDGVSVPKDLKAVAYDGTSITDFWRFDISIIRQPVERLAARAVETLLMQIQGQTQSSLRIVLPPEVINCY